MKTFISAIVGLLLCFASASSYAQCSGRYYDKIFPGFYNWRSSGFPTGLPTPVVYGNADDNRGNNQVLDMYIFQPQGDTAEKRPLLILAFGGSFISGFKESPDVLALCDEFVRRGFVTASIKYRTGADPIDSVNMLRAVMRGVQDMRAAIRFFYKDASTTNTYRIDTNAIFAGGVSAGAFIGVHLGFIDDDNGETPQWLNDIVDPLGGFEGNSGNPGYSSKIRGIVNLAGAIGDTAWIDACDPPMVSMHGTDDGTVPYCSEVIEVSGNALIEVDGSASMKSRTSNLGLKNPFYTHRGGGHVDFTTFAFSSSGKAYMDTTIWFVQNFLFEQLTGTHCGDTLEQAGTLASPCGKVITAGSVGCTVNTGVLPAVLDNQFVAYPNPSGEVIYIEKPSGFHETMAVNVYDNVGRLVERHTGISGKMVLRKSDLGAGLFYVTLTSEKSGLTSAKGSIMFQ